MGGKRPKNIIVDFKTKGGVKWEKRFPRSWKDRGIGVTPNFYISNIL